MTNRLPTFGIQTPRALLAKLERELSRIAKSSPNREDLVDYALNSALTAWQIVEWVWKTRFCADTAACDEFLNRHENLIPKRKIDKFKEALARDCPDLALCRDVSNGIKHLAAAPPTTESLRADHTTLSATVRPAAGTFSIDGAGNVGGGLPDGAGQVGGDTTYRLEIISDDGERYIATDVFHGALTFWRQFMDRWGIG